MIPNNHAKFLSLLNEIDFVARVLNSEEQYQDDELLGELLSSLDDATKTLELILDRFEKQDPNNYADGDIIYSSKLDDGQSPMTV